MKFLPTSDAERNAMLAAIGVKTIDDLFAAVPAAVRQAPDLPPPMSAPGSTTITCRRSPTRCSTAPSG